MKRSLIAILTLAAAGAVSAQAPSAAAVPDNKTPAAKPATRAATASAPAPASKPGEAPKGLTLTPVKPGATTPVVRPVFKPIVRAEHLKREAERFDKVDKNKNGVITENEMRAYQDERRAEMRERMKARGQNGQAPTIQLAPNAAKPASAKPASK